LSAPVISITDLRDERCRRLYRAWLAAKEAAVAKPHVEAWRVAVAAWDAFKAEYDRLGAKT
jgi:hypothetical protein